MKAFLALVVVFAAQVVLAENLFVVKNGSVAKCQSGEDMSKRSFRMRVVAINQSEVTMLLETHLCLEIDGKMQLIPFNVSDRIVAQDKGVLLTSELTKPSIHVTDSEVTRDLLQVAIDGNKSSQLIKIPLASLAQNTSVDMTITGIEVTKKNNVKIDQGMISGGHYRLRLQ